jgi:NAD(P)-dependent dehydrogenase (short-subunit alcohol dehydrogenase family)
MVLNPKRRRRITRGDEFDRLPWMCPVRAVKHLGDRRAGRSERRQAPSHPSATLHPGRSPEPNSVAPTFRCTNKGDDAMDTFDAFGYQGKRALVVGGATGMGAAVAQLAQDAGAEVVIMDIAEASLAGAKSIHVNLAERASIDAAVDECGGPVHALFSCAGVADGTPGIERINFIGHRHLIDRMLGHDMLPRGSAIGFISSAAGLGGLDANPRLKEYLATPDFDAAVAWVAENGGADYMSTKQAICAYVSTRAFPMLKRGIRINAICPGPTDTPLAQANKELWLDFGVDYRAELGIQASTPLEQAYPLVFLCSDAAAAVNGSILITDNGYMTSGLTDVYPPASDIAKILTGRMEFDLG